MQSRYRSPIIQQLRDQQVRFAPRDKKLEQVELAERLLSEIEDGRVYTYEYLCYRITGYRPDSSPKFAVRGEDVQHDLRLFVEDVSDAANIAVEDVPEPVYTVEELGKRFNVSTKTISRWRQAGLVSRRFSFQGRKRVGFLKSSVDRFVTQNTEKVRRGGEFSQLTEREREEIIYRARRLARAGGCPSDVTRRVARHMNRSVETIRYTLKEFDQKNREMAVFPRTGEALSDQAKDEIYRLYRRQVPVEKIAKKYCRTKSSVFRIVNETRARHIMELPLDFIENEAFLAPDAETMIMAEMPRPEESQRKPRVPGGLPPYLTALYEVPLLTREQEQHLFRQFNYLKFRAAELRRQLDPARAKVAVMDQVEQYYDAAVEVKNRIVQANLRLVVSIAKRHVTPADNFFELVSDGNMSLIRAAEKFDYARGNKFSTYASWAIMKNYARTIPGEYKYRDRFRTTAEETFMATPDDGSDPYLEESAQQLRESQISKILARLDDREQKIIISRFGLDHKQEPLTLKEVGEELGVTKERIRQLEARALNKLRLAARESNIELP
jgi:RNA polymerase primary sigma factor/RNA polymerase sigma factor